MRAMPAAKLNLTIEQGAAFRYRFRCTNTDLTGFSAAMQIRDTVESATVRLSLTSDVDGGIVITPLIDGSADSTIDVHITDTQTAGYKQTAGVYDIKITPPGGEAIRLIQGNVKNSLEVTR
jgi:hypothetical protein